MKKTNGELLGSLLSDIRRGLLTRPKRLAFEEAYELLNREALFNELCGTCEVENTERHAEFYEEADKAQEEAMKKLKKAGIAPYNAEYLRNLITLIWEDAYKKTLNQSKLFDVKYRKLQSEED